MYTISCHHSDGTQADIVQTDREEDALAMAKRYSRAVRKPVTVRSTHRNAAILCRLYLGRVVESASEGAGE